MSQFNPVPNPVTNGIAPVDEEKAKLDLDAQLKAHAASQHNSIITGARYTDEMTQIGLTTGTGALRQFNERMEAFGKAMSSGASEDIEAWEKIRLDVATEAERHASNNDFWVESIHEGAWEQARSMTSDEHWGFLGTDLRARNQFMHDAGQNSDVAKILGLTNSPEFLAAAEARGVDTSKEGSWGDTLSSPFQSLFTYDDISDMVTKRVDPTWTAEAQDNAWEAMNSSEAGRYLIQAAGMKRDTMSRFTNQDALIYGMNRLYKEAKFQQHASADDWGGMLENFGQMLPTIINDPDTIGEVGMALLLAIPSGGASVYVSGAAKAGSLTNRALATHKAAKGLATAGRLLPTRVLGDFVVPGVKAFKAARKGKELKTTASRLRYAWNNMDEYDNWVTFLAGASADGVAGGVGAFLMNTQNIDDLNSVVYGKGQMASIRSFDQVALRGLMGVAGAVTLGSALRVGFKGLTAMADKSLKGLAGNLEGVRGKSNKEAASSAVTAGITRKILAKSGIEDEAIVTSTSAGIERDAGRAGVAPHKVAARMRDEVDLDDLEGTPEEKAAIIREAAHDIIKDEFVKPDAVAARHLRRQELERQIAKGKTETDRAKAEDEVARDDIQTGAIVQEHKVEDKSAEGLGKASQETAEAADPVIDDLIAANKAVDDARAEARQAAADRAASKAEAKKAEDQRLKEKKEAEEAAEKENAKREAEAQAAKQKQLEEQEKALAEAKAEKARIEAEEAEAEAEAKAKAETEAAEGEPEGPSRFEDTPDYKKGSDAREDAEADIDALRRERAGAEAEAKAAAQKKVDEAAQKVEEAKNAPVEFERVTVPEPPPVKKVAKKAQAEASQKVHTAEEAQAAVRKAIAQRLDVDEVEVDAIAAQVVSHRMLGAVESRAHDVVDGFEKEGFEEMPVEVLRHALVELDPEFARSFDNGDSDMIDLGGAHNAIRTARRHGQGNNFKGLTEDPNAVFLASRFTRGSYEAIAKQIEEHKAAGPAAAYRTAQELKLLVGGGSLRDYQFRDNKAFLEGTAYFDKAIENLKTLHETFDVANISTERSLGDMIKDVEGEVAKVHKNQKKLTLRQELHSKFGYPAENADAVKGLDIEELTALVGYHRFIQQVDDQLSAGKLNIDQMLILGVDREGQRLYFMNVLNEVNKHMEELRAGGHDRFIGEVEMLAIARPLFGPESDAGVNLRDAVFGPARGTSGVGTNKYDLAEVRRIAEERLARVDADFNTARSAAARAEMARLEGKVKNGEADLEDRIRLAQYNSKIKTVNEIDYLEQEMLAPYRAVSQEAAAAKRQELGEEGWAAYLRTEEDALYLGARNALFGNHGISVENRNAIFKRHGIPVPQRGSSPTEEWKSTVAPMIAKLAAKDLGFDSPMDLVNGSQSFVRGNQAGLALIGMYRDGASLTGDTAAEIKADTKVGTRGETYAHVRFSADRTQNPTGNLKVQKQVKFIEEFMLREGERQILFNPDGTPREFSHEELNDIIEFYTNLKNASAEEIQANVPKHPFEQKDRGLHLVSRDAKALGSPVRDWSGDIKQKMDDYYSRMLQEPVHLHQGIHDDLTLIMQEGVALNNMGAIGPMVMRNSQGAGSLDGLGAGWQTLATVPGGITDWLNIRSGMIFRQFDGMDAFARAIGLESLKDMRDAIVANDLRGKAAEGEEIEIPEHIANLKGEALKKAADAAGIKKSLKVGEKRKLLALAEKGGSKGEAELREAAEMLTLIELDTAVRKVDEEIRKAKFEGGTLSTKQFDEILNSWDAASQAVSLAKGLFNAAVFAARQQAAYGKSDANVKNIIDSDYDIARGIDEVKTAMGWDPKDGFLNGDIRMEMLKAEALAQNVSAKLDEEGLAVVAADFYSTVWDGMIDIPAEPRFAKSQGRLQGRIEGSEGTGFSETAFGSGRFGNEEVFADGADMWNHLFDSIGKFGSKQEIGEEAKADDPGTAAQGRMKKFLRDKLMKRPVMTRSYGAGGDAMSGAIADFLEEAFSIDTPAAAEFRGMVEEAFPDLAKKLEADAKSGNRQPNSILYQTASVLGWAFADKAGKKWKGEGGMMGKILKTPDAKTFRDSIRNLNSLHADAFNPDLDLQIEHRGRDAGSDSTVVQRGEVEMRNITYDDLYAQRSMEDTAWEREPAPEGDESPQDKAAREERNEKANRENYENFQRQVKEKAVAVAKRRGWSNDYGDEFLATVGRWHMKNLMLIKSGAATVDQIKVAEENIAVKMREVMAESDTPELALRDFLENWLTRRDELTIRAMNSVGYRMRNAEADSALKSVGLTADDLDPKMKLAHEAGLRLHSSIHSSAGRGWTGAGQGGKGWVNPNDSDRSIRPVYRAVSDEHAAPIWELDAEHARGWNEMSAEDRNLVAAQLVVQDMMIDFLGVQNPPIKDYVEPTVEGFYRDWAANESRATGIREKMEEIRQEWRADYRQQNGEMPEELSDILWDDIRSQVPSTRTQTLFGQGDEGIMTDAGIPQLQAFRLRRTSDIVMRDKIKAAMKGEVSGPAITLGEMAVPSPLKIANKLSTFMIENPQPVAPRGNDGMRIENDKEWLRNWTWREVNDYSNSIGIPITDMDSFGRVFRLMHVERAVKQGMTSGTSKLKSTENGEGFDLKTIEGQKGFMDTVQRDIQSYLEELMGETEIAAKKEAGTRDVQIIPDTGTAYPAGSFLQALRELYVNDPTGNWMHADALLGPAPREGIVLEGSNITSGALITGIMAKSVFSNDFGIGMGAAEESVRFGHWFIMTKFGVDAEEAAFKFNEYAARRLEDDADGSYYEARLKEWQEGFVDESFMPANITTLMGLGSVRETLMKDPEAMGLARKLFGISKPEELTQELLQDMITEGDLKVLQVEDGKRRPAAYIDSLGRDLTLSRVPMKTLLWRTMGQLRASGIDPKSQPMIRRLWFASMLEMKMEKLNLVDQMGAREYRSRAFSHLHPDREGKVSQDRIDAARKGIGEVTDGANRWMSFDDSISGSSGLDALAYIRGSQILGIYENSGVFDMSHLKSADEDGEVRWNADAAHAAWAYHLSGKDEMKMASIAKYSSRAKRNMAEGIKGSVPPVSFLRRSDFTEGMGKKFYDNFNIIESRLNSEVEGTFREDIAAIMGDELDYNTRGVNRAKLEAVMANMPERDLITDASAGRVLDDMETEQEGKLIAEGVPDNSGPIFSNGRTLANEFDKVIREKRYPALNTLIDEFKKAGVFKDEDAAREFGLMMAMNMDLLGDLLPGIKFQFTGEAGTAKMRSMIDSSQQMLHRVSILKDMRGMEAMEVFDIVVHEIGHAIVHRGMALGKGAKGGGPSSHALTSMRSQFHRRILQGTPEDLKTFNDAFVAIHGDKKGNELFKKFYDDLKSGDSHRQGVASQEFAAQMMSWYLLSRTIDTEVTKNFGEEFTALYRAGYGDRIRKIAKIYETPKIEAKGIRADRLKPATVLERLGRIANTAEPVLWSGRKAFNEMWFNHSSNINTEDALRKALTEAMDESRTASEEDLPMIRNKIESLKNRLAELGHATPSERSIAGVQRTLLGEGTRKKTRYAMRDSGLTIEERAKIARKIADGDPATHEEFGRVRLDGFTEDEKKLIVDHMIDGKIAGRRETVGDSKFRRAAMFVGEGIALQGTSSAWRSMTDEINWAAQMLNNTLGFEERSAAQAFSMGMSQQEIQTLQRALYGKPMSASIELFEMAQKIQDPEFVRMVDDAFEETFIGHPDNTEALDELGRVNPHAANLVETASREFAKLYDRAYKNAHQTGEMDKWVVDSLVGDGNRQLPIQLSQIIKEDSAMREMSIKVGDGIRQEQIRRLEYDPSVPEERQGFVNAQFMHDYGIFAPWKSAMSPTDRARHVDTLDSVYGSDLVDIIIDEGKLNIDESKYDIGFDGGDRSDEFWLASQVLQEKMEAGQWHAKDMPTQLRDVYKQAMQGRVDPAVFTDSKNVPFYMRHLDRDFPDPEDRAKFRAVLASGREVSSPADYEAMKMLYRSRHGGYSFANNRFMSGGDFRRILNDGVAGRGLNRTPINVLKTFMAFDHGVTDKFFNQEYYGITGFGYGDLLNALKARVHRARVSQDGTMVKLSDSQQRAAIKEIENLESQYRLAQGRNPSYKDESGNDFLEAVAPTIQTAVGLATTPNWTTASLIVEGTAGLVNRAAKMFTDGTKMTLPKYAGDMGAMRDSMHAIGITMPYHMTKLGFGHIWNMGDEASAAMALDPSLKESFHDKANKKIRRLGSFAFERVQLAQREAAMIPAQQLLRKMLVTDADGNSKAMKLADALNDWIASNPEGTIDAKLIRRLAKENGVKADVATQMHGLGLLSPEMARRVSELAEDYMPDNTFLKYEEMFDAVAWEPGLGRGKESLKSGKAATGLQQLLFNQVAKTNMEPRVGTTNLNTSPVVRMWQQLSQYSILFMREVMAGLAATGLGATAAMLMPLYFGEVMWYSLNRMKNGDSPEAIAEDWRTDAPGQMTTALARMPVFGAGSFLTDMIMNSLTSSVGKLSGGAVFGSKAQERSFGMNTPGMPGPSMMIQSITAFTDLVKQGGSALLEGNPAEAASQAKEFLYKYGPAEFRPLLVAGLRGATGDFKDASGTPQSHRPKNLQILGNFNAVPEYRGPAPKQTRLKGRARDYAKLKADYVAGFESPKTPQTTGDSSPGVSGAGTPQGGSSGLSGTIATPKGNAMGPGSAGGSLADKLGK